MATSHSSPIEAKDVAPQPADVPTTSAQNVVDVTASNAVVPIHTTMSGATPGTTREVERHERLATAADRPAKPSRRASQPRPHMKIGRASGRARVGQYVSISVVAVELKNKKKKKT